MYQISTQIIIFIIPIVIFVIFIYFYQNFIFFEKSNILKINKSEINVLSIIDSKLDLIKTRDFISYVCKNMKRIGGHMDLKKNAPHPLYRIDGAWFICFDDQLAPVKFNCNVLSFGINFDYTFDMEMNKNFGCNVFSFDPFIEADIFAKIRAANMDLSQSIDIKVNRKWNFYKLGLSEKKYNKDLRSLKIKDIVDLNTLLKITNLENHVIDILKIDIEGPEKGVIEYLDMEYTCKFFKQIVFETHRNVRFRDLVKLEKCFFLFKRDTRFFEKMVHDNHHGTLTEFQTPNGYNLSLQSYHNETYLAEFMFVTD